MIHELKTWQEYFIALDVGVKKFELRKNDRNFTVGDTLLLREFLPIGSNPDKPNDFLGEYTGREILRRVTYILKDAYAFGLQPDYVILGIE